MANFKDIKGGDPEGLQNHNKKKPEAKSEPSSEKLEMYEAKMRRIRAKEPRLLDNNTIRFNGNLSDHEKRLIILNGDINMLEDFLEDILEGGYLHHDEVKAAWEIASGIRGMLHTLLEIKLRCHFSIEELLGIFVWIQRDEEDKDAE